MDALFRRDTGFSGRIRLSRCPLGDDRLNRDTGDDEDQTLVLGDECDRRKQWNLTEQGYFCR